MDLYSLAGGVRGGICDREANLIIVVFAMVNHTFETLPYMTYHDGLKTIWKVSKSIVDQ